MAMRVHFLRVIVRYCINDSPLTVILKNRHISGTISCFLETMVLKHTCYNSPSRYRVLVSRSQQDGILAEYGKLLYGR